MNGIYRGVGVLAVGAALVCASAARAQTGAGGSDRFSGNVRGSASYSSNVAGGDATVADLKGVTPADITYDLGATVDFRLPSGRQTLFLTATADVLRHQRNAVLNAENYNVTVGGSGRVGLCGTSAVGNFGRQQTSASALAIVVTQNITTTEGVTAGLTCGQRALVVEIQAGYLRSTNSATDVGFIGSETSNVSASVGYQNNTLGTVSLGGQYSKTNYLDGPVLLGTPSGFEQYSASLSYARKLTMRLNGTASVSLQELKSPATAFTPAITTDGLGANVGLNYRVSSRMGLQLGYHLSNEASPIVFASYVRVETLNLSGNYALNQRVSLHFNASEAKSGYHGGAPLLVNQVRNSRELDVGGGATIKIGRKISLSFDASHSDRNADLSLFTFNSNQATVGLIGTF